MRALLQRVRETSVHVEEQKIGHIGCGLLIFLGISEGDTPADIDWLVKKILNMRIFPDSDGKMNHSILDADGEILVVSQFTLHARVKKGNRPSFDRAARPESAIPLYEAFVAQISAGLGKPVPTGEFGADMQVSLINDGPVTIWLDSHQPE